MKVEKVGAYWAATCFGMQAKAKTPERAIEKLCIDACKNVRLLKSDHSKAFWGWVDQRQRADTLDEQLRCATNALKKVQTGEEFMDSVSESFALSKRITELEARLAKYEDPFAHNG